MREGGGEGRPAISSYVRGVYNMDAAAGRAEDAMDAQERSRLGFARGGLAGW